MDDIRISDVAGATRSPSARVSEILAALGASPGNHGRRAMVVQLSDAIRAGVVRGLVMLGVPGSAALDIARQITAEDLKAALAKPGATWLGVCLDEMTSQFTFALCDGSEMQEIATDGRGSVRFLDIQSVGKAIVSTARERQRSAATEESGTVTSYTAEDRSISGIVLDGLAIGILQNGRGKRVSLTVEQARDLGRRLLAAADEADPAGGLN